MKQKTHFISFSAILTVCVGLFFLGQPVWADDDESLNQAIDATRDAIDRLEDKMQDLIDTVEDAEPFGEEPYLMTDDQGGFMTGNETVDMCLDEILDTYQDWLDFHEQFDDLQSELPLPEETVI